MGGCVVGPDHVAETLGICLPLALPGAYLLATLLRARGLRSSWALLGLPLAYLALGDRLLAWRSTAPVCSAPPGIARTSTTAPTTPRPRTSAWGSATCWFDVCAVAQRQGL